MMQHIKVQIILTLGLCVDGKTGSDSCLIDWCPVCTMCLMIPKPATDSRVDVAILLAFRGTKTSDSQ